MYVRGALKTFAELESRADKRRRLAINDNGHRAPEEADKPQPTTERWVLDWRWFSE